MKQHKAKSRVINTILWILRDSKKEYWQDNTLKEVLDFHFELIERDMKRYFEKKGGGKIMKTCEYKGKKCKLWGKGER